MNRPSENPFVFGEIIDASRFVDREKELRELVRDLADGQKVFLLSPRRFGKSSLVSMAFLKLRKQYIRTVIVDVSSYSSYGQFLEKFAEKVIKNAGAWEQVKSWVDRFVRTVRPEASVDLASGEFSLSLGKKADSSPMSIASEVFALPGELAKHGDFRMAICLDEFQQIQQFGGIAVENVLRSEVQQQRKVGYVFSGSQPSLMDQMLAPKRPFHKSGPRKLLDKIPADAWTTFISDKFAGRGRRISLSALKRLLEAADLIPYDVQRIAHELWDHAELMDKKQVELEDVENAVSQLVRTEAAYFERQWEQLTSRQRAVLQVLAQRGSSEILSHSVREQFHLGPASSVQKALQSLDAQDVLDRYKESHFFIDPLFARWIREAGR